MSRAIDAEWVIKRLQAKNPSNDYMKVMLDECIAEIKSAPTIEPDREAAIKDCRNCKYGKYNDYWSMHFCYNRNGCDNWNLWEVEDG